MVTKHSLHSALFLYCLNLAKIHMVTKLSDVKTNGYERLNLAKIHMVTKPMF